MAVVIARIQNGAGADRDWSSDTFHRVDPAQVGERKHWWCVLGDGVHLLGDDKPLRTPGQPVTLRRIFAAQSSRLDRHACELGLHRLIAATIAVESVGNASAERYEPHIRDYSIGLTQTLTATAHALAKRLGDKRCPAKPIPKGGTLAEWRAYLRDPDVSIRLVVAYYVEVNRRWDLRWDPILLYAAFNAGSPRPSKRLPWGLVYYDPDQEGPKPGSLDRFAAWYGDACAAR